MAGLLLVRGASCEREMALRVSLGAGRLRLVRQALTESLLLSFMGGLLGLLFAAWGTRLIVNIVASGRDRMDLSVPVALVPVLFTAFSTLFTGLLFGLVPAV